MKKIRSSAKKIECLRVMYPGNWYYAGGCFRRVWVGEHFSVIEEGGKLTRSDTGEPVELPPRKKRSHLIHNILHEKLGGVWVKHPCRAEWSSEEHKFKVHRAGESVLGGATKQVYRRTDTKDVVFRSNGRKFYREEE